MQTPCVNVTSFNFTGCRTFVSKLAVVNIDFSMFLFFFSVKADSSQKASEEAESAAGLGPDLAASVETTYSEQSSSSAGSASSSDQPIYFRYEYHTYFFKIKIIINKEFHATNNFIFCKVIQMKNVVSPLLFSGSFVSRLKCLSGWTIMANTSSLNR